MIDVSDPTNPTYVGCFGGDGYVHDAQCVNYAGPDERYTGREICYCYNEASFTIVDVTDKANAVMLSRAEYEGYAYTHQVRVSRHLCDVVDFLFVATLY